MSDMCMGERIRKLRESRHYTREVLAEKADISAKFLYEIETGKKGFSAETLCKISRALCVSCDFIMRGEKGEQSENQEIIYVLETLEPRQVEKIRDILSVLTQICDAI